MRVNQRSAVVLVALLATAACHKDDTSTTPTTPTVARTTDTFTGTVAVGGDDSHSFPIAASGNVDGTLTATAPPATIVMGLSIGMPGDGRCVAVAGGSTQTPAGSAVQLSGVASPGTLCVDVRDVGGETAPITYTVTVTHP
jgi:hypothetical protein